MGLVRQSKEGFRGQSDCVSLRASDSASVWSVLLRPSTGAESKTKPSSIFVSHFCVLFFFFEALHLVFRDEE